MSTETTAPNNYFKVYKRNAAEKRTLVHEVFPFNDASIESTRAAYDLARACREENAGNAREPGPELSVWKRARHFGPWSGVPRIGGNPRPGAIQLEVIDTLPEAS